MNRILLFLSFLFIQFSVKATDPVNNPEAQGGVIKGVVMDSELNVAVEYATVSVYNMVDSTLIDGTITNVKGEFELKKLKPGKYYVEISFIGYNKATVRNIPINKNQKIANLKVVNLRQATESLDEVVVTTERLPVQYQIDKKVIPVSRQITAASGTAVDVLENVPSVSVDIEGNVSLRGSSNFTVLVDGKPSILDAADVLEQMPASLIESIEIITNPSAKYNPEGTAGIINIITKKGEKRGLSGVANLNMGTQENYGGDVLINYQKKKWNLNFGVDYGKRGFKGEQESENRTISNGITNYVLSNGDMNMERLSYGFQTGFEYEMDSVNLFSFGIRYGKREMERGSVLDYEEYSSDGGNHDFYDSKDLWDRNMKSVNSNFSYQRKFKGKGHQLLTQVVYSYRDGDEVSTNELSVDNTILSGQKSTEVGPGTRWEIRSDYTLPLGGSSKIETGYQGQINSSDDDTKQFEYNTGSGEYDFQSQYSHKVTYDQQVHGLYGIYASNIGKFGYQLGARVEYTNRDIKFRGEAENFELKQWNFFPTIHTQYDFGSDNQVMASYTRRIQRPRGWNLEPFITWTDAYNVRKGNPSLENEFIDSYELGYMKRFGDQAVSFETYYRVTQNKIERVRSVYQDNVMLSTSENVGRDYSLGLETTFNLSFARWFKNDLIGNFYHYREKGDFATENSAGESIVQDFSTESFNWSIRNNTTLILDKITRLQFNLNYQSPTDWAQGRREAFFTTSAALKREFFKRKLSATFQVRDIFGGAKHETVYSGDSFYNHSMFKMDAPSFHLNLSFKINNYQKKKERKMENGGDSEDFEM